MPLTFDLPLEQLKTYRGINPRPADFDQFWEDGLREMKAVNPDIELVPAGFQVPGVECLHLYFTCTGGARVHAKLLRPQHPSALCPALLHFHGYACSSSDWSAKLNYAAQGFIVAALDCRGQGGSSEDKGGVIGNTLHGHIIRGLEDALAGKPEKLLFRQIFLDTAQMAGILLAMPEVDPARVFATGWSQGGALTMACAALEPRIKKAAPVYPFLSDYKRVWEMDQARDAYLELRDYFRLFDPQHLRDDEVFEKLGYIDIQHLAPRVKAEVLWGTGLMDTICPPSSQFAAFNKIISKKRMVVFPDFAHEDLPGLPDEIMQFMLN